MGQRVSAEHQQPEEEEEELAVLGICDNKAIETLTILRRAHKATGHGCGIWSRKATLGLGRQRRGGGEEFGGHNGQRNKDGFAVFVSWRFSQTWQCSWNLGALSEVNVGTFRTPPTQCFA